MIANCILIGDQRKFLVILLCLKQEIDKNGAPLQKLTPEVISTLKKKGIEFTTIENLKKD